MTIGQIVEATKLESPAERAIVSFEQAVVMKHRRELNRDNHLKFILGAEFSSASTSKEEQANR